MTKSFVFRIAITLTAVGFLAYWLYDFFGAGSSLSTHNTITSVTDTTTIGRYDAPFNDELPHREYKRLKDSIDNNNQWRDARNNFFGNEMRTAFIGFASNKECDTCSTSNSLRDVEIKEKYYLSLPGYILTNDCKFIVDNGKYYIKHTVWDKEKKVNNGLVSRDGHYEVTPVPFRLARESGSGNEYQERVKVRVLIPLSSGYYTFTRIVVIIFAVAFLIFALFTFISLPIGLLIRIYRGEIFNARNLSEMKFIGWTLILLPVIVELLKQLLRLAFKRYTVSPYIKLPFDIKDQWIYMVIGGAILILAKAFHHGYSLKKEQDLTI